MEQELRSLWQSPVRRINRGCNQLDGIGASISELLMLYTSMQPEETCFSSYILTMLASLRNRVTSSPVSAYLILAILAAPALIKSGINPMAAHLFILHCGVLGNITPPSAPCSFAAAGWRKPIR